MFIEKTASDYSPADYSPLRDTDYGIGFHWTTWVISKEGDPLPYHEAVRTFDVDAFADQAVELGASHVLFTLNHAEFFLPCPSREVDRLLPGRTCERDLIADMIRALRIRCIPLLLYYQHGHGALTTGRRNLAWREACGATLTDKALFFENQCRIIAELGERYGDDVIAWWFDGGMRLHEMDYEVPWANLTQAAKAGHPDRLVTYNPGVQRMLLLTECQDYYAGEGADLSWKPENPVTPIGLPLYSYATIHPKQWGIGPHGAWADPTQNWPAPAVESIVAYIRHFRRYKAAVTLNIWCYQDGSIYPDDFKAMLAAKDILKG